MAWGPMALEAGRVPRFELARPAGRAGSASAERPDRATTVGNATRATTGSRPTAGSTTTGPTTTGDVVRGAGGDKGIAVRSTWAASARPAARDFARTAAAETAATTARAATTA